MNDKRMTFIESVQWWILYHDEDIALWSDVATYLFVCCLVGLLQGFAQGALLASYMTKLIGS